MCQRQLSTGLAFEAMKFTLLRHFSKFICAHTFFLSYMLHILSPWIFFIVIFWCPISCFRHLLVRTMEEAYIFHMGRTSASNLMTLWFSKLIWLWRKPKGTTESLLHFGGWEGSDAYVRYYFGSSLGDAIIFQLNNYASVVQRPQSYVGDLLFPACEGLTSL